MPPSLDNICAIIVTYFPDPDFITRLEKVLAQFPSAIVVDNGSCGDAANVLRALNETPNVQLVKNMSNLGIATALNQGVEVAFRRGFEWVVTFDQDTIIFPNMRNTLTSICAAFSEGDVMVGGNYWDERHQRNFIECRDKKKTYRERKTLITSGTLMSISLTKRLGGFREDYFIDSVDHEFSLRARAGGCKVLISCEPVMRHSIGSSIKTDWISRFSSFNHAPVRKYFIARNAVATARLYFFREPAWSLRQACRLAFDLASILLFEENKAKKTKAFLIGILHGLAGKMGSIERTWPHGAR